MRNATIVVSGATGDAGRAVAAALVSAGHVVVVIGSDAARLASVDASHRIVCNLSDAGADTRLAAQVHDAAGPVDGLVHLVGGWKPGHDTDSWDWLEPRLLTSLRLTTLAFHDDLTASAAGRLVVIGSASASKPTWSGANYATLKSAGDAWVAGVASGWRKAGTAAAVTLVVSSIGGDGTSVSDIVDAVLPLWERPAADLNGAHITL